jgi:hypothetical protein
VRDGAAEGGAAEAQEDSEDAQGGAFACWGGL